MKRMEVMIKEAYVSFEVAKLLKEKGFNEPCRAYWDDQPKLDMHTLFFSTKSIKNSERLANDISCPTHQMATAWLRENHNIGITPYKLNLGWYFEIFDLNVCDITGAKPLYKIGVPTKECICTSYQKAVEAALKYALENLL